jgi:hypothetical protein
VLLLGPPTGPDGTTQCTSELFEPAIYASGVGSGPLVMPDGVAMKLAAGQQLLLNLHLFNSTDNAMTGTSGIQYIPTDASDVENEAGVLLAGKAQGLVVVPGNSTQSGTCTLPAGETIFAAAPHMHTLGTYFESIYTAGSAAAPVTMIDKAYSFDQQQFVPQAPMITTVAGSQLDVTCTYFNPNGYDVYFGESTTDEMCFSLTYMYPPPAQAECTQ